MPSALSFYIKLDEKDKFRQWNPGDRISGYVHLNTIEYLKIHQVSISFTGKTRSKLTVITVTPPREYHGGVTLFELQTIFIRSPYTFPASSRERWPFEFIVPDNCSQKTGETFDPQGSFLEPYNDDPAQPLPPSFADAQAAYAKPMTECSIEYALCAVLHTKHAGVLHPNDKTHELLLQVQPFRTQPEPVWTTQRIHNSFRFRSLLLEADAAGGVPTFGQKMWAKFHIDALPIAAFDVVATMPKIGTPGQALPVSLGVKHDFSGSTARTLPAVSLREFRLELVARTQQATKGGAKGMEGCDWTQPWEREVDVTVWKGDVTVSEELDLHAVVRRGLVLPDTLPPTFNTFNVSRCYSLRLDATIECAEEKQKFEV